MKKLKTLILLGTTFATVACGGNVSALNSAKLLREPSKALYKSNVSDNGYDSFKIKLADFSTKFSESFLKSYCEGEENITISPLSLEMCLGLAICASNGESRQEMLDVFDMDFVTFNKYYKRLYGEYNDTIKNDDGDVMLQLLMTNSIWIDDNFELYDSGLDALRDDYYCYSYNTDFSDSEICNRAIEEFIEIQTKGLLKPKLNFDFRTIFVLMNTLYLKDIWNSYGTELNFSDNSNYYFVNSNKEKSSKKLLEGYYSAGRTIETENYSSFFTETNDGFKIHFIKPNDGKTLKEVFTKETMDYVMSNNYVFKDDVKKENYFTRAIFPEFNADCDVDFKSILMKDFNIKSIFKSETCDFSNLISGEVYCSGVNQIAKLDVNKKGIEGAAVTYMPVCGETAIFEEEKYKDIYEDFVVNKEFGFILTYKDSVLFSGVINNIDK